MRPRIVLHVGPHKTGSTYLQQRLVENRDHLSEQGVCLPATGWVPHGHHRLVDFLRGWVSESEDCSLEALKTEIAGSQIALITSENFVLLKDEHLLAFRNAFKDYDIEVVFFLRHPVNVWPSHWQELIKHGSDITFAEYMLCIHGHSSQLDISPTMPACQIGRMRDVFGIDRLSIVVYENIFDNDDDIFEFFWRSLLGGRDCQFAGGPTVVNPSFPGDQVELIRQLNAMYAFEQGKAARFHLRQAYRASIHGKDLGDSYKSFVHDFDQNAGSLLMSAELPLILEIYQNLTTEFSSAIINRYSDKQILRHPIGERHVKYGPRDWIFRSQQLEYIRSVYTEVLKRLGE